VNTGDFFEHEDVGDGVEAGTAPLFGHEHAAAAESAKFLDGVQGKVVGALPISDVRANLSLHELAHGVADEELVISEGEIHGGDSNTGDVTAFSPGNKLLLIRPKAFEKGRSLPP
jgi:hypothetical protein